MPLYEFYCKRCDGVFESVRAIASAYEPAPCPACAGKSERIMPTSFNARTIRDGYPRAIPDLGTYWHLGKEVKTRISGSFRPNEHPELTKPEPPRRKPKGEVAIEHDKAQVAAKEHRRAVKDGAPIIHDRTRG